MNIELMEGAELTPEEMGKVAHSVMSHMSQSLNYADLFVEVRRLSEDSNRLSINVVVHIGVI